MRSPLLLVAVPTLAWRFWSTNPSYWGLGFQYSAVLMPVVFVAFLDALTGTARRMRTAAHVMCALAVGATLLKPLPLRGLLDPHTWRPHTQAQQVRAALAQIPDNATVAADNHLAPQLTSRCTVYLFPGYPEATLRPEWVAVSTRPDTSLAAPASVAAAMSQLPADGYRIVLRTGDVTLFHR